MSAVAQHHARSQIRAPVPEVSRRPEDKFFSIRGRPETRRWDFEGVTLEVTKRSYSQAEPAHISYQINLGPVLPEKDRLIVYVKHPKDDDVVDGLVANCAAYKRCLDDLIANAASFSSQKPA
ncbi:hypothetical protein GSI_02590 [Ganoderma sinense ZZ0214-1]|uniref:Uncharacterized protein n=1 Tax=Ganoderma sinense ZZ0214-1 TaxID=1077348 RepID=A0A2G8SM45_9APHY|nr:hypothetical protein GSI_02590 [Ganoderma sinense ZZ0214-1]